MPTRLRARRVLIWSLTSLLTLFAIAWLLSIRYYAEHEGSTYRIEVLSGQVFITYAIGVGPTPNNSPRPGWKVRAIPDQARGSDPFHLGFILPRYEASPIPLLQFLVPGAQAKLVHLSIPIWVPMTALAIPTTLLWYTDRLRPTEGHCPHCNYDLTGILSNKCPECGTPTPKPEPAAREPTPDVRTRSASAGQDRAPSHNCAARSPDDLR